MKFVGNSFLVCLLVLFSCVLPKAAATPKLIVVISIDQLRRDRLTDALPGGLGKLSRHGRVFVDASLDHGITNTCPGHSVILTGVSPGRAGIPGNTYIDHETFTSRYCVDDDNDDYRVFGGVTNRSPRNMKAETFGDWLKIKYSATRVFSVGGKDRAAITLGGQNPDGVFWYHSPTGKFTSSGYYAQVMPDYLVEFNGVEPLIDGHLNAIPATWIHLSGGSRIDDYEGESSRYGRSSGHPLRDGSPEDVYLQVYYSPVVDTQTIALARRIVVEEKLGQGADPDLLTIALSATDTVGHLYGPRSAEAEDVLRNVDELLGDFIKDLEAKLGDGNVLVALTADHGVAELPEYAQQRGTNVCPETGRLSIWPVVFNAHWEMYRHYTAPFNSPTELFQFVGSHIVLNRRYIKTHGLDFAEVLTKLDEVLTASGIIKEAWTHEEINEGDSEVARLLKNSLAEGKSGDILIQLHRGCVITLDAGTTHGSVYDYDRDVPVLFYGWGVAPGKISGEAHSVDIGPTLADHVGLTLPAKLDGTVLNLAD